MICPSCKNSKFYMHAVYKVVEEGKLLKEGGHIGIEVDDIFSIEPIESFNEFKCTKCGNVYTIGKENGEEVLVLLE